MFVWIFGDEDVGERGCVGVWKKMEEGADFCRVFFFYGSL